MSRSVTVFALATLFLRFLSAQPLNAAVQLRPGATVDFATLEEGRRILGQRDLFIQSMSQFDRCVRMKTAREVTEEEFVNYITNQVRGWSAAEQTKVTTALNQTKAQLRDLNLTLPSQFLLVKTTGNEEGNAAYLRGTSIILPQGMVAGDASQLQRIIAHEVFHEYMNYNPQLRGAFYGIIGFQLCNEVPLPPWLVERRITGPNPMPWDFFIRVLSGGERIPCMLVFYSKSTNYTGGQLFDYLVSKLLVLEKSGEGYQASCWPSGIPRLLDTAGYVGEVDDYHEQIGKNTSYIIHPEEILAENFVFVAGKSNKVISPRVPYLLKQMINRPTSTWVSLPAGRFWSGVTLGETGHHAIEVSDDLQHWDVYDVFVSAGTPVEVVDLDAWLHANRFYRARAVDRPVLVPGDTNNMVWIPPGTFLMGSPPNEIGRYANEGPQTTVTLTRGFWFGKYEVTQAEYEAVMGENPSQFRGVPNLPAESMTWNAAVEYCGRVTAQALALGKIPSGYAYRLPTEAEWEYAARAGTRTRYSFGDDPEGIEIYSHEWFGDNAQSRTHAAGLRPPNPWELHDIHGNVAEWCSDWFGSYPGGNVVDPQGRLSGTERVLRCGAMDWLYPSTCRSACRSKCKPDYTSRSLGFRIVLAQTE